MKRLILLSCLLICFALFATVTALVQGHLRPQFKVGESPQTVEALDVLPQKHLNQNRLHKLIVKSEEDAVYEDLTRLNAIRSVIGYAGNSVR